MTSLLTHVVYIDKIRREERYWGGDNPRKVHFRKTSYDKEVGKLLRNVLMPVACSLKQIMTSRGISLGAKVIRELKRVRYKTRSKPYMSNMEAFIAFNSLEKLIIVSRKFAHLLVVAGVIPWPSFSIL